MKNNVLPLSLYVIALKPLLIFLIILTVLETVFPFLPEDWQFFILLFFLIPVIYPCLAICTYITGAKTGECLSGKTLERFVIALIVAVLITFLIRPYHSIISNLHAYGRTSFISWVFFNKPNLRLFGISSLPKNRCSSTSES